MFSSDWRLNNKGGVAIVKMPGVRQPVGVGFARPSFASTPLEVLALHLDFEAVWRALKLP